MLFLQTLESKPVAKPRIAKVYPKSPEALVRIKNEFDKFREYGFVIEVSSTWSASSFASKIKTGNPPSSKFSQSQLAARSISCFTPRVVELEPKELWTAGTGAKKL